jgi:hypothetical protein
LFRRKWEEKREEIERERRMKEKVRVGELDIDGERNGNREMKEIEGSYIECNNT